MIPQFAGGQSLPAKREASDLVKAAIQGTILKRPQASPFHLIAKVHYEIGAKSHDGNYELIWMSPDRYREEFRMGAMGETQVALGDKIHILRTTPTLSFPLWRIRSYMVTPISPTMTPPRRVVGVRSMEVGRETQVCVRTESGDYGEQFCFDPATREILSIKANMNHYASPVYRWNRTDFVNFGRGRFPKHQVHLDGGETIEVAVVKLEEAKALAEDVFAPPPNAMVLDWCPNPSSSGVADPPPPLLQMRSLDIVPAYYVFVGRTGRAEKIAPVVSGTDSIDSSIEHWALGAKFPIQRCGGRPIEYEQIIWANTIASQ